MAYDYFQNQDQQDDDEQSQMRELGAESPVVTGNTPPEQGKKASSGQFTNLNAYLDANADQKFGEKVAGRVGSLVDNAEQEQKDAETTFKQQSDQGTVKSDDALLGQVRSRPQDVDVQQFAKMRDATYAGPQTLSDNAELWSRAQGATDKAYNTAEQTKDEGGRKAYLNEQFGSGAGRYDYSRGQQKLDNLLIQQDPNSKAAFEAVRGRAQGAKTGFDSLNKALNEYAAGNASTTAKTRADSRSAIGIDDEGNWLPTDAVRGNAGAAQDDLEALDELVASQKANLGARRGELEPAYDAKSINGLSPETLARLGITPQQFSGFNLMPNYVKGSRYEQYFKPYNLEGGQLLGVNPRDFITLSNDVDLNRSTLASPEMQARIAALTALAGKDNTFILPEQAGRMVDQPLYGARGDQLVSDVASRRAAMQAELQAALARFNGGTPDGLVGAPDIQAEGNRIRAKYGLPPL